MSAAITGLLDRAAREYMANEGVVSADTMMALAAEGYDLDDLEPTMEAMAADD